MNLLDRVKAKKTKIVVPEGLTPEQTKELEAQAMDLRLHGRAAGQLYALVGQEVNEQGQGWPRVLENEKLGTLTVPATLEGLLALITTWDSKLLDEELVVVHNVVKVLMPMGLMDQRKVREERAVEKAEFEHMKEHHPEDYERAQGWRV